MAYYSLLTVCTVTILVLAIVLWKKTSDISFIVGVFFLYYWSLYGGWFIVADRLGNDTGMRYGYLEEKLFPIYLDDNYFLSLSLYAMFIIIIQMLLVAAVKKPQTSSPSTSVLTVSHRIILMIVILAGIVSYTLVRSSISQADILGKSAYAVTRVNGPPLFTLHQVLNRIALIPLAIGLAVQCSGNSAYFIRGRSNGLYFICYLILASGMFWFCLVLGNKSELFAAGVAGTLFYMANSKRPRLLRLIIIGMIGLVGLWLIDFLRSVPLRQLLASVSELKFSDWLEAVSFISSSNEAFGAHFSMYGVLSNGLYPTYGSSIVSLVASIIPRIVWSNRPADIYLYYSEGVDASVGQGYSIHHATGWYLNYGVLGIIIGGILLASVWAFCFNFSRYYKIKKPYWLYVFSRIAPWTFVASIPALVRGGPEAYKGLFIDGFLIPVMVLSFASLKLRVKRVS